MFNWKKWAFAISAALLLFSVTVGESVFSYLTTGYNMVESNVKDNIPVEFEIQRLRDLIEKVDPQIRENYAAIAKEEAQVKKLDSKIAIMENQLEKQQQAIVRLRDDLATGEKWYVYASHSYTADQVKNDLANRFTRYETQEATLTSLKQIRDARQKSLNAAIKKIEQMREAKRQLLAKVESLEAQKKLNEVAAAGSNFSFDASALGQAKELAQELETRLEVERERFAAESYNQGTIQLDEEPNHKDVMEKIAERFGHSKRSSSVAGN